MRPNVPCLIVDPCNTVHALHFIGVETVPAQNVGVVVPVRGYFIYGQKTFCAVGDGGGEDVELGFCTVGAGLEGGVYVVYWVYVCETVVGVGFEVDEMFFEEFHP